MDIYMCFLHMHMSIDIDFHSFIYVKYGLKATQTDSPMILNSGSYGLPYMYGLGTPGQALRMTAIAHVSSILQMCSTWMQSAAPDFWVGHLVGQLFGGCLRACATIEFC